MGVCVVASQQHRRGHTAPGGVHAVEAAQRRARTPPPTQSAHVWCLKPSIHPFHPDDGSDHSFIPTSCPLPVRLAREAFGGRRRQPVARSFLVNDGVVNVVVPLERARLCEEVVVRSDTVEGFALLRHGGRPGDATPGTDGPGVGCGRDHLRVKIEAPPSRSLCAKAGPFQPFLRR